MQSAVPFILGAKRLGLPVVGNVASWDHTVGKGVIHPGLDRYIVQNERMRDDLVRYHGVPARADRGHRAGRRATSSPSRGRGTPTRRSSAGYGLDPALPVVLVMGNTPTNTPDEGQLLRAARAVVAGVWRDRRFQLLFRPHPRDREWRDAIRGRARRRRWRRRAGAELHRPRGARDAPAARRVRRDERRDDPRRRARQRPTRRLRALRRGWGRPARAPGPQERDRRALQRTSRTRARSTRAHSFEDVVAGIEHALRSRTRSSRRASRESSRRSSGPSTAAQPSESWRRS